ncbi:MAG: ubiquitin-like domain-containing protein [Jatrophihabitantaceae bacterium]
MLRSVKYGLYGAVLAGLVGGTVAWTSVDKTVTLVVDGQASSIHTTASDVGAVLTGAGYHDGAHDLLAPSAQHAVHDGSRIVYQRGRLLSLDVNGVRKQVWTTAPTVAAALAQLGYSTADFTSVSRSARLPLGVTDIAVRTPKLVTVVHDGKSEQVSTTDATVGQLLSDLGIVVGKDDRLSPAATTPLSENAKITVTRVRKGTVTASAVLPFPTRTASDPNLDSGQTVIVTPGADGLARITYAVVYVDGKMIGKTKIKTVVVRDPVTQVKHIGTRTPPPPASPPASSGAPSAGSGSGSGSGGSGPPVAPGSAQAIARQLLAARGWGNDQFNCLVSMWDRESGWNVHAANPSGAYGIPQALPGSKMSSAGPDWQNNAETQIKWGLGYISSRYGTPCGAWATWQANGGWY